MNNQLANNNLLILQNSFDNILLPQKNTIHPERGDMTICIAAICDNGKSVIVGADREIILLAINFKFSHNEKKIDSFTNKCAVLSSGDAFLSHELIQKTKEKLKSGLSIRQIAETLKEVFFDSHIERVENIYLKPLGYKDFNEFKEKAANQIPLQIYQNIHNGIWTFGLNLVEFLVAGCDESGGHIYRVYYSGVSGGNWIEWCDKVGYRAIGTGLSHAFISLSVAGQNSKLSSKDTLSNIIQAKKMSEFAPGVGKEEDFAIITFDDGIKFINEQKINPVNNKKPE
jgi:hypothetical protein